MDFDFAPIGAAISARLRVRQHGALRGDNNPWNAVTRNAVKTGRKDIGLLQLGLCRAQGRKQRAQNDGEEGWEKAQQLLPDVVISDVMMPRLDGFEVAQRLRKNPQTANTSIIMLTAKDTEVDKVVGLEIGADDYVTKPYSSRELLARVKAVLRRGGGEAGSHN